jgi:hypothetical protein
VAISQQPYLRRVWLSIFFRLTFDVYAPNIGIGTGLPAYNIFSLVSNTGSVLAVYTTDSLSLALNYNDVFLTNETSGPLLNSNYMNEWTTVVIEYLGDTVSIKTSQNPAHVVQLETGIYGILAVPGGFTLFASSSSVESSEGYLRHVSITG